MFNFYLEIPLLKIYTEVMRRCYERYSYTYIAWNFELWKWRWTLYWGKSNEEAHNG